jgi:hypothetical protein
VLAGGWLLLADRASRTGLFASVGGLPRVLGGLAGVGNAQVSPGHAVLMFPTARCLLASQLFPVRALLGRLPRCIEPTASRARSKCRRSRDLLALPVFGRGGVVLPPVTAGLISRCNPHQSLPKLGRCNVVGR